MKYNQPLGQEVFQQFPEHEWNYADLYGNETEIRIATIYEYTRCCGWIADKYVSWLDSPIEVENSDAIGGLCARSDGLSNEAEEKRREDRLKKMKKVAKAAGRQWSNVYDRVRRFTKRSLKFFRTLRAYFFLVS